MKKHAFSLLELAIVLIIISILVVGVTQGAGMIAAARIANARSLTAHSPVSGINGLIAWYETSSKDSFKGSEAVEGGQITEWYDISPNSIAAKKNKMTKSASAGAVYRAAGINKIPAVQFNGTDKIVLSDFYQGTSSQNTIFAVFRILGSSSILTDAGSCGYSVAAIEVDIPGFSLHLGTLVATGTGSNPAAVAIGGDSIIAAHFNSSSSGLYFNNASTMAGAATINPGSNVLRGLTIGSDRCSSSDFSGLVSEVIVYNRILKSQERKDVMGYLSKKYGVRVTGV